MKITDGLQRELVQAASNYWLVNGVIKVNLYRLILLTSLVEHETCF